MIGLLVVVLGTSGSASAALADPYHPTDQDKAAARPLGMEGLQMAVNGDCRGAVDKLSRAEALVHAPTTAVPLAQCEIQLGKVLAGTEILNRVVNEPLPPNAPQPWVDSRQRAQSLRDSAQARIAKLRIHVDAAVGAESVQVMLDGQPLPATLLDQDLQADPGTHHVTAKQGAKSAEADVSLGDAQSRAVSLNLLAQTWGPPPGANSQPPPQQNYSQPPPPGYGPPPAQQNYGQPPPPGYGPPPAQQNYGQPAPGPGEPYGQGAGASGAPWMAVEFGVRLAFGFPFGGVNGNNGNDVNHVVSNQFAPLWLDGGFRFLSNWYVGGSFSYGFASIADQFAPPNSAAGACKQPGVGCSSSDIRLGVNAHYHVLPDGRFDPWFGVGFGYEWLSINASGNNVTLSEGVSGWEFANLQAGLDFRLLNGALGLGPFVTVTFDQYSSSSSPTDNKGGTTGGSITNQSLHEWLFFGVRGDYDLKLQ